MHASARVFVRFGIAFSVVAIAFSTSVSSAPEVGAAPTGPAAYGYVLLDGGGGLYLFNVPYAGAPVTDPTRCPNLSCTSMALTPSGLGYWILDGETGKVYAYGTAGFYGDPAATFTGRGLPFLPRTLQIVATPDAHGYWVYGSRDSNPGTVLAFGTAGFYGDTTNLTQHFGDLPDRRLNGSAVGMAATATGKGYWEVYSDGGVFAFGDAKFYGSTGGIRLTQPIVGITATATGKGYWLVAADGGVFAFGDAVFGGSMGGIPLNAPVVGMVRNPMGSGYWLAAADGGVFTFGGAPHFGTVAQFGVATRPIVAIAARRGAAG
jgi:hypothetical protein